MRKPNLFNLLYKGCDAYNVNYNISVTLIFVVKSKTRVDMYKEHNKRSLLVILLGSRHEARSSNNVTSWRCRQWKRNHGRQTEAGLQWGPTDVSGRKISNWIIYSTMGLLSTSSSFFWGGVHFWCWFWFSSWLQLEVFLSQRKRWGAESLKPQPLKPVVS